MILDSEKDRIQAINESTKLLLDLEKAVLYALSEITPNYRIGVVHLHLQFHIKNRKGYRVTPEVIIDCGNKIVRNANDYRIDDINAIYDQIENRLTKEKLTWNDVDLDIYQECINNFKRTTK